MIQQQYKMVDEEGLIQVRDDNHFQSELDRAGNRLVVVDFFATW